MRTALRKSSSDLAVPDLRKAPIEGWFHAVLGGTSGYVSADGCYFIAGDLFDVPSRTNLSEQERSVARREVLRAVDPSQAIVFAPSKVRYTVTVFTDVDCGYRRKLHSQIAHYTELGIAVRYLAYPRTGSGTDSWQKMEAIWCSADRAAALTKAKLGETVTRPTDCKADAVARHYELANKLGIPGTPMIILDDGRALNGYVSAEQLADMLR